VPGAVNPLAAANPALQKRYPSLAEKKEQEGKDTFLASTKTMRSFLTDSLPNSKENFDTFGGPWNNAEVRAKFLGMDLGAIKGESIRKLANKYGVNEAMFDMLSNDRIWSDVLSRTGKAMNQTEIAMAHTLTPTKNDTMENAVMRAIYGDLLTTATNWRERQPQNVRDAAINRPDVLMNKSRELFNRFASGGKLTNEDFTAEALYPDLVKGGAMAQQAAAPTKPKFEIKIKGVRPGAQ